MCTVAAAGSEAVKADFSTSERAPKPRVWHTCRRRIVVDAGVAEVRQQLLCGGCVGERPRPAGAAHRQSRLPGRVLQVRRVSRSFAHHTARYSRVVSGMGLMVATVMTWRHS